MIAKTYADTPTHEIPGIRHMTLAGPSDGLRALEVWHQRVAPGAATPWHRHDCEEVVVVLQGTGCCEFEGRRVSFGPQSTLIVPANVVHQITNTGDTEAVLIAALSMAPVEVRTPDGERIPLPWSAPA